MALPLLFAGTDISMLFYTYILVCLKLSTNMDKEAQVTENHHTKTSVTARGFMIFDQKINGLWSMQFTAAYQSSC